MLTILASLCILIAFVSSTKKYVATFKDNNFTGEVIVDNGMVSIVDLDLSMQPDFGLSIDYETCITGGLSWHIHKWLYDSDTSDKLGAACGPSKTGGHIDDWHACGPASGNMYCATSSNTYNYSCIPTDTYSDNIDFSADPFSAEIGDWSGKYEKAVLTNDTYSGSFSSYYEVTPDDLNKYSVVFHCNDGKRAFCAPLLESTEDREISEIPSQTNEKSVVAKFNTLSDTSMIILNSDGSASLDINAAEYYNTIVDEAGCPEYEYTIFNAKSGGSLDVETSINGADCKASLDGQYDPTHQCLPWSASEYCTDGALCEDPTYEYDCAWDDNRYSCAPGDLSGKWVVLDPKIALTVADTSTDTLLPPVDSLIGKIIAIHCPYDDVMELEVLSCAMIQEYSSMMTTEPGDDATQYSIMVLSMVISVAIAYL